ncbi:unnamed protein product [Malus baccata var. baccata]
MTRRAHGHQGINRRLWAPNGTNKLMKFNDKGQPVKRPQTVARFSRFLGRLSLGPLYFPINIVDWRNFYKANIDRAWQRIKFEPLNKKTPQSAITLAFISFANKQVKTIIGHSESSTRINPEKYLKPTGGGTLDWTYGITLELEQKIWWVCEMKLNDRWKHYKASLKKAYYTSFLHSPLAEEFHCPDGREKVNGSKPNCITFFTLTHTRKNGEPVDARSAKIIDNFNRKQKLYEDRNEIITDELHHIVYANVLGPERNNCVRGFGTGVVWSDVPSIITKKMRISREVEAIRASYKEQRKVANIEIERLRMKASERDERQMIESANVLAQLRKEHIDSMVAHKKRVDLEVETMKREMRAKIMSALKKTANGDMVQPIGVDVTQVCINRIKLGTGLEIQASGDVEAEGFVVVQNIGTDDEIGYRPCILNVIGINK